MLTQHFLPGSCLKFIAHMGGRHYSTYVLQATLLHAEMQRITCDTVFIQLVDPTQVCRHRCAWGIGSGFHFANISILDDALHFGILSRISAQCAYALRLHQQAASAPQRGPTASAGFGFMLYIELQSALTRSWLAGETSLPTHI